MTAKKESALHGLTLPSPLGPLTLWADEKAICRVSFGDFGCQDKTPLLLEAKSQLEAYFAGTRQEFDLPLSYEGTAFQTKVWDYLRSIPYGKTISYRDLALGVDSPKGFRAVGAANGKNPLSIFIPCHRVINAGGGLGGYAGGLDKKTILLELEQKFAP